MITYRSLDINGWKLAMKAVFSAHEFVKRTGNNMEIKHFTKEVVVGSSITPNGLYLVKIVFMITSQKEIHYGIVSTEDETTFIDEDTL